MNDCDGSYIKIHNAANLPFVIQGVATPEGTVKDLYRGEKIPPTKAALGIAHTGGETGSRASGVISIQMNEVGDVADLNYSFSPTGSTGFDRCKAVGKSVRFTSAGVNYTAVVTSHDQSATGKAAIEWRILRS